MIYKKLVYHKVRSGQTVLWAEEPVETIKAKERDNRICI